VRPANVVHSSAIEALERAALLQLADSCRSCPIWDGGACCSSRKPDHGSTSGAASSSERFRQPRSGGLRFSFLKETDMWLASMRSIAARAVAHKKGHIALRHSANSLYRISLTTKFVDDIYAHFKISVHILKKCSC
jgi:hypothetical protein